MKRVGWFEIILMLIVVAAVAAVTIPAMLDEIRKGVL